MPLNRPTFDSSEQSTSTNQILTKVLNVVQNMDEKLDAVRAEHEALKEHVKQCDSKLTDIAYYVKGKDSKLDDIKADCVVLKAQVQEIACNAGAVDGSINKLGVEQEEMKKQMEKLLECASQVPNVQNAVLNAVREKVREYCSSGDWPALRQGLMAVLDESSAPYKQVRAANTMYSVGTSGHVELAALLLDAGMPVNYGSRDGFTLLHGAAEAGQVQLVSMLLGRGANVEARTKLGSTPLIFASSSNQLEVVEQLVLRGTNVNAKDHEGWTSLHWAARKGYLPIVQRLVLAGADTTIKICGKSALDLARQGGHTEVVQLLSLNSC